MTCINSGSVLAAPMMLKRARKTFHMVSDVRISKRGRVLMYHWPTGIIRM
jgi:hypothetical protein